MKLHSFGKLFSLLTVLILAVALICAMGVVAGAEGNEPETTSNDGNITLEVTAPYKECGKIKLSWKQVSGAYKYVVYCNDEHIATSLAPYYTIGNLDVAPTGDEEILYTFKVVAVSKNDEILDSGLIEAAAKHSHVSVVTDPTCVDAGYTTYTCACGDEYVADPVDPLGHDYGDLIAKVEPKCEEEGVLEHYECGRCHLYFDADKAPLASIIIAPKGHNYGDLIPEVPAKCEEDGVIAYYKCSDCEKLFNSEKHEVSSLTIPMLGHSFTNYVSDGNAGCGYDGTKTAECDNGCGTKDTIGDAGSALDHVYTNYVSDGNAKCGVDGTKTAECDNGCGETDTVTDTGSALTHAYTNYVSNNDAKCGVDGTKTATCDHGCGETDTVTDAGTALTHVYTNYVSDGNAKCGVDGTKTASCDNGCGETDTVADTGSALTHSFTNYVSNGDETCANDGTKTAECDHGCGETDTVANVGSATGNHNWVGGDCETKATCSVCGAEEESVSGEHVWNDATCSTPKTCSVCGKTEGNVAPHEGGNATCTDAAVCSKCGESYGSALGHSYSEPTCDNPGICSRCGSTNAAPLGHDWKSATCTTPKTCKRCNKTEGASLGHSIVTDEAVEATCQSTGLTEGKHCTRCDYVVEQNEVPKLEHSFAPDTDPDVYIVYNICEECGEKGKFAKVQIAEKDKDTIVKVAVVAGCLLVVILCIRALKQPATTTPWYKRRKYR